MSASRNANGVSFGLACIDGLINPSTFVYDVGKQDPIVTCIAGPDGVGKSILGLTAASLYAANQSLTGQRVIYASTDLSIGQADRTWTNFGLDRPKQRRKIIREGLEDLYLDDEDFGKVQTYDKDLATECELVWLSPFPAEDPRLQPVLQTNSASLGGGPTQNSARKLHPLGTLYDGSLSGSNVYFLDLAEFSAGDDWGLINHIVGLLRCMPNASSSPHLLVIDAVEGLEAMTGRRDSFGLKRSRRSRLAQLVRLTRKANCSVIFIIEQKSSDVHLDEVFVSDLVLRLRTEANDEYLQKTIEVEKARSVSHIRGTHDLQIRDGRGSGDGVTVPDDPCLKLFPDDPDCDRNLGYMQVIPSLHQKPKPTDSSNPPNQPAQGVNNV